MAGQEAPRSSQSGGPGKALMHQPHGPAPGYLPGLLPDLLLTARSLE